MMDNTTIFIQQSPNFQFLSVCNYITTLGIIFYNRDLIALNERNQSIPVINTLFEYLNKSENESKTKLQLLKDVLKGTDFHGGGDNETLDGKYVDETYHYIISEVLFSHYGNINGYLAKIINEAEDISFFALKEKVLHKLSENYIRRDYCSLSNETTKLTPLTIKKVFQDHIWTMFPQPEQDMSVIDVNYIYAMVGLKIARSISSEKVNLTFHEYIIISREIDLEDSDNGTYQMVLTFFSTPALFFYAFKQKDKFRKIETFIPNEEFWSEAYENLFTYISSSVHNIVHDSTKNSLHYKLDKEINNLMSRTLMAYEILKVFCRYDNVGQVFELHVGIYKTFYHWITKLLLPSRCRTDDLPELERVFEDQFENVETIYNQIEQNVITKVLVDGNLVEKMNSNATVLFARVPDYRQGCNLCSPPPRSKNKDIYLLFAIQQEEKTDFYALRQENNVLTLVTSSGNEQEFSKVVSNYSSLTMEIEKNADTIKYRQEDYKMFVERIAKMKTEQFVMGLKKYYFDETLGEKYLNVFKSLIPFYSCVESVKSGDAAAATLSCTIDVLSLIPFVGFSAKYSTQLGSSLAKEIGSRYLLTNSLARAGIVTELPIITVLKQITKTAVRTIAGEILTKGFLKDFAVASIRALDPGFELFYKISNFGLHAFRRLFQNMIAKFKNIPTVKNTLSLIKSIFENFNYYMNLVPDRTGLVPLVLAQQNGYEIVRYFYPGGSNVFGPRCVTSFGKTAELRSIEGYSFEIPVVPVKYPFYKQYIPETGKIVDSKLQMGDNDILRRVGYLLDKMFAEGHDINMFRNFDVYHNTAHWKKGLLKRKWTEDLDQSVESSNPIAEEAPQFSGNTDNLNGPVGDLNSVGPPISEEVPQFSGNTGRIQKLHHFPQSSNLFQNSLQRNTGIYNDPQIFDPLLQTTSTGNVVGRSGYNFPQVTNMEFFRTSKVASQPEDPANFVYNVHGTKNFDAIPGSSKQTATHLDSKFYLTYLKEPMYYKYVDILLSLKNYGLPHIKQDKVRIKFLRSVLNKLALIQLDMALPLKKQKVLWYSQILRGPNNIDFLQNLKGKSFCFNDITMLSNKEPGNYKTTLYPSLSQTEVRYRLTIDSPYGLLDLTHFQGRAFENYYIIFNDMYFTVTDTYFTVNTNYFVVELKSQSMSRDLWHYYRQREINNLEVKEKKRRTETTRMESITKAANFMSDNAIYCIFESSRDYLKNFILSTKPSSTNLVPTYQKLAEDFQKMEFSYIYDVWKIEPHQNIQDVLFNYYLDDITISQAENRIEDVYGLVYCQDIREVFKSYKTIPGIREHIRFEDYYVIYSEARNTLLRNKDEMRRFEAAINRISLRQCSQEWIMDPIKLYRREMISKETSARIQSLQRQQTVQFDHLIKFTTRENVEQVNILNQASTSSEIPLFLEITLNNQAGVADIGRILNDGNVVHVMTSNFEFKIDDIRFETIYGHQMLVMKMHDFPSSTESRMVLMAKRLHQLFAMKTEYYSNSNRNVQ